LRCSQRRNEPNSMKAQEENKAKFYMLNTIESFILMDMRY